MISGLTVYGAAEDEHDFLSVVEFSRPGFEPDVSALLIGQDCAEETS